MARQLKVKDQEQWNATSLLEAKKSEIDRMKEEKEIEVNYKLQEKKGREEFEQKLRDLEEKYETL